MKRLLVFFLAFLISSCNGKAQQSEEKSPQEFEVTKTEAEWKEKLSAMQYRILRKGKTERAFSSPLNDVEKAGTFVCAGCGNPLYKTKHKFDSGTGWPSFDRAIKGAVGYGRDTRTGFERNEVHCAKCGGHLGHIFNDGPGETTGKRHCINGAALKFFPD